MATCETTTGLRIYLSNPMYLIKTGFLVLTWIVMGFHLEIIGPTMRIITENVRVDLSGMGSALAARSAGYFVANILGAILQNIVKRHSEGLLVCAFILPAIVVFATPFVTSLVLLCFLFFFQGIAQGLTDLGGTNIILTMWGNNAAAPLNTAHLGYGIGAVFVNLLVRPFLDEKLSTNNNLTTIAVQTAKHESNILIPYTITACLCILIAIGHVFFYVKQLKTPREQLPIQQDDYAAVSTSPDNVTVINESTKPSPYSPKTCGRGFFQYGLTLSVIFFFYTFFIGGNDQTFSKFYFAFLNSERFNISAAAASWGIILYWLSYSIGRLIGAIVSVFVSVDVCLNVVWFAGLCLAIAWFVFVWTFGLTATSLFVLGALTGLVFAPIFPLSFGFYNQKLNVIPLLIAILLCGSALGAITFQKIAGLVLDQNPNHFPTLLVVCMIMSIFLYISASIVAFLHQRKQPANIRVTKNDQELQTIPQQISEEEQQMESYLKDQDNK